MDICLDHVSKKFGTLLAIDDVSFNLAKGEFVFLTGPSGSGKSTIIRLLLREIQPTSGQITIGEFHLDTLKQGQIPALRRRMGVVFQDFKLLYDRTVWENVALGLLVHPAAQRRGANEKISEVLTLTGLWERRNFFPAQLAGGEMQRVCLARAVVAHPDILLADEPTGNLDVATSWQIIKLIRKIHKMGTTVLMVTHNVDVVNSFSDRVLLLKGGKLVKDAQHGKYEF